MNHGIMGLVKFVRVWLVRLRAVIRRASSPATQEIQSHREMEMIIMGFVLMAQEFYFSQQVIYARPQS
jgi:hypothetical protein